MTKKTGTLAIISRLFLMASLWMLIGAGQVFGLERLEPPEGCYVGVGIGFDSGEWDPIDTVAWWSERMGGMVAGAYEYFTDYPIVGKDVEKIESFMQQVIPYHGIAIITLRPFNGLSETNCSYEVATNFAGMCARWEKEGIGGIMVRFGNEMNAGWFPWGQQPTAYRHSFRLLATNIHAATERTAMIWDPNEGVGFPWPKGPYVRIDRNLYPEEYDEMDTNGDGGLSGEDDMYAPFYPGDDAVDWVGMSSYHWGTEWPWGENEIPETDKLVKQIRGLEGMDVRNFYDKYCRDGVHNKPLMISETAALFNADRTDGDSELAVKSAWWEQLYNAYGDNTNCFDVAEHLPKLKMICWFDRICHETEINCDRIVWGFSTPSDIENGWVATNHTWLEDFEHLDTWWQPWDVEWSNSGSICSEGSNSLLLRGLSITESNKYIGGCGRSIGDNFFDAKKILARFEGLDVNGWDGQPRATVDDFEIPDTWNGIPWGFSWTLTGAAKDGTNAICMSGPTQHSTNDYVGGNLRPIQVSVFQPSQVLAEMQDLTAAPTNVVYTDLIGIDMFESVALWTNQYIATISETTDCYQGSKAAILNGTIGSDPNYVGNRMRWYANNWSEKNGMVLWVKRQSNGNSDPKLMIEVVDSAWVTGTVQKVIANTTYQPLALNFSEFGCSGAFNWSAIMMLKVHLLPSEPGIQPSAIYLDNWNVANVTQQYPNEVDWNTTWGVAMTSVNDPVTGFPVKSMLLHGNAATGESHIGGVRGTLREDCADWSGIEAVRVTMRRGTNNASNPDFSIELKDAAGRSAFLGRLIESADYTKYVIPKSDMDIATGFDWSNLDTIQMNMGTTNSSVLPADIYVKNIELGTMTDASTISDWRAYDGVEIWAKRETSTEPDPVLMLEVVSGSYTANAARTVSSKGVYEPLRIYYTDFTAPGGFSWGNISELRVGMLSTSNGVQPGDLYMDAWSVVATEKDLYDQDWWTPWVDTNAPASTNKFEFKLEADPVIGGTNVLTMWGLDFDVGTNTSYGYIGGSGFSVRAFESDWSDYTHLQMILRRDAAGNSSPVVQITITDKSGRVAHIGRTINNTNYLRQVCAFADMEPETGFDWSAVQDVKFELLSETAHVTPGKLYIQDIVLGVMPHESPKDWSAFNGMEIKIRRANESHTHPLLRVTVESVTGSVTNEAVSFIAVRNTNDAFKAMRIPLVEMHQSVRPFPWDKVSNLKIELFSEEEGVLPDAVYVDDWALVNLAVNPDDPIRTGYTDYVRQLRDGKRYFLFQQDEEYQRLVSPYAAWTRDLAAVIPLEGPFQVRLPVNAANAADVVVELYDRDDRKIGEGRTTIDAGFDYADVTLDRIGGALTDRAGGCYYKTYITTVGGTLSEALALAEDTPAVVRKITPTVQMMALPKTWRPGDQKNVVVRYASDQAGWLFVKLVDSTNTLRGMGKVFVQGGSSEQWVYTVIDDDAPVISGYTLQSYLSSTEDGAHPISDVESISVYVMTYMNRNRLYYVPPTEIIPDQTIRVPIGYTIISNKFNILMELVNASGEIIASEEDAVYDNSGVVELMLKPGNYPVGDYDLCITMRDDIYRKEAVSTNEEGEVTYNYVHDHYVDYLSKTSSVKVVEQGYADWVRNLWVYPVFSDPTDTADDANLDRVKNYEEYTNGLNPLRPIETHFEYYGLHEPLQGVYLAAFINGNSDTPEEIEEFTEKAGKGVAVYGRFVDLGDNCYPAEWMERIHYKYPGAGVHLVLEPWMAFTNFYGDNWAPGKETYEQTLAFVTSCATSGLPVFLRFAHEANGWWYPWCPASLATDVTPAQYIEGWRNFAEMVHTYAPNVATVWAPNQGTCDRANPNNIDPDALADYAALYPGDDAVDWVGMSQYNGKWYANGNEVTDYQFKRGIRQGYDDEHPLQDFYWEFSDPDNKNGHRKPMMIAETSSQYVPQYSFTDTVPFVHFESIVGASITHSDDTLFDGMETALTSHWNWDIWDMALIVTTACVEGTGAIVMHADSVNTNSTYIGGFGRDVTTNYPESQDWTSCNGMTIAFHRESNEALNPIIRIEMKDVNGNLAKFHQEVSWTNYQDVQILFDRFDYPDGFLWSSVIGITFHLNSPLAGMVPADLYMDNLRLSSMDTIVDQEWAANWNLATWEQTVDSVSGKALRMGGVVTNGENYVGGCIAVISRADRDGWTNSDALAFYVKRQAGTMGDQPDPKLKIILDSDWVDNNETEASVEFKISNTNYAQMVIPFEDFQTGEDFEWGTVNKMTFHMFTADGPNPYDLYIDEITRTRATVTNKDANLSWKSNWINQLYSLEDNTTRHPYYVNVSRNFRNIHMINWFHIRKIEDGEMRDFRLPEFEGANPVYSSYYERVASSYFLTNVVVDRSNDGIPDDWAQIYFGDVTNAVGEADSDGDGMNNRQEYIAGTNPKNMDSFLYTTASVGGTAQNSDGQYIVTWPSEAQRVYSIAYTTNMLSPMSLIATNIPATYPTNTYTGTNAGFYRIMVSP